MNPFKVKKYLTIIAATLAALWTLIMGLAYGLLELTEVLVQLVNVFLDAHPGLASWLRAAAGSVEQWGGFLVLGVWMLGLLLLISITWFARRIAHMVQEVRHTG